MTRREAVRWLAWGLLAVAVGLAWSNGLHGEFTYDDKVEVVGNRTIRFLDDWRAVLTYNWSRPLLIATYALNYQFGGFDDPFPYHVVDVALQAVNAGLAMLLVAELAAALGRARPLRIGLIAAGLWSLHPMATEAVSYVTGRSEQLCATFYMLACWSWVRWLRAGGWHRYAGAWFAVVLAAMSKEVAATLPVAFLLLDAFVVRGGAWRQLRWRAHLPSVALIVGFVALRLSVYGVLTTPHQIRPLGPQLWTQAEVIWHYVALILVPVGQSVFHDYPVTGATLRSVAAASALVGVSGLAVWGRKKAPVAATAWLWFLLVLAPSSSFVALRETMAEHRAYLPMLGFAWLAADLLDRLEAPRAELVSLGLCAALIFGTHKRNERWATEVGLWAEAVAKNQDSAEAWYGFGDALRFSGLVQESATAYTEAVKRDPSVLDAWVNLGIAEAQMNHDDKAVEAWQEALKRSPSHCKAHNNLALLHARRNRFTEAAEEFRTTLVYCRSDPFALYHLATLYDYRLDDPRMAVMSYQELLRVAPDYSKAPEARQRLLELTW